jgi:hypothetical protein
VLAALVAGFVPVVLLDRWLLEPRRSDWISIDLRGTLALAYAIWLLVQSVITTSAIASGRSKRLGAIHLWSAVTSAIVLVAATVALRYAESRRESDAERERVPRALELSKALTLDRWR